MEKRLTMLIVSLFMFIGGALAQTKVNGTVVSQDDGQPVVGASVLVVGTQVGTVTNSNGQFSLTCPAGKNMLRITYVGMEPLEVSARPNMRILLTSDQKALDEVIVVAFGTAKKSAFTGSAKIVGSEELSLSQVTSVTDALAGSVPGVQIVSASGDPSSTGTIRIRGFSSLNAGKDPLIVVDGAPYSGDMANLNPADIESMTVLKDAASNALYGARGANGVIMITTKRAKVGQDATVTFDAKWGANSRALQHYNTINSVEKYYEMQYGALRDYYLLNGYNATEAWTSANANLTGPAANGGVGYNVWTLPEGQVLIGRDGKLNPNATLGRLVTFKGEDYWVTPDDWEDVGTRTGTRQEYNVTVSAANEKSSFYSSLGYLDNEGITENSDMKRLTGRLRADYQAKKWLKVGANAAYTRFEHNSLGNNGTSTSTGNIWAFTSQIAPIYPIWVRNADGSIKIDENGIKMMDYGTGPTTTKADPGLTRPFIGDANPVQDVRLNTRNFEGNAFNGTAFADFTFMPGLVFTVNATANLDETRGTYVYNPYYGQFDTTGGTVEKYHSRSYDYNLQQLLNYNATINNVHNIGVMLGHEYTDVRRYYLSANKSKMFSQDNKELGGAVVDGQGAYSYKSRYNNEGYFGRAQYDYDQKYFASASLRRDASSRFDPEYRWGTFWSVGAAWLMNKENWFNVSWIDELKLKLSYGSQGNDNIGSYLYTDQFSIANSSGNIGTFFSSKGTKDITWETNANLNAGFEFQLFKKLTGSLEWYYRKTTDMLYSFSVAPSLGYSSYYDNIGDLYNTGLELDFNYNVIHTKDINWDIHVNFATLKNNISKLDADKKVFGLDTVTSAVDEEETTFDVMFRAIVPNTFEPVELYINIEFQKRSQNLGYPVPKRGGYYCSRMISKQYGTVFTHSDYGKIRKVYSIWICPNVGEETEDSIVKYSLKPEVLHGHVETKPEDYDILDITVVSLTMDFEKSESPLIRLLGTIFMPVLPFEDKKKRLEEDFHIPMSQELEEDLTTMCNLGDGIYEYGEAQGVTIGEKKLAELMDKLFSAGRVEDAQKAVKDEAYRTNLYKEFHIN